MNLIEKVVRPLKSAAIQQERKQAEREVDFARKVLTRTDWDIQKAAPYPSTEISSTEDFYAQRRQHNLFHAVTIPDTKRSDGNNNTPYVLMDEGRAAGLIEQRGTDVASEYDAFVAKLLAKIGPVKAASLEGNHVGGQSILSVTTKAGEDQRWKIQHVVNLSKHGKPFNQWTIRRMKR